VCFFRGSRRLAFTRYCHCQYCVVCIAITGGRGETLCCAIVCAMTGWGGVPNQRVRTRRIVLIRAQRPRHKTISCLGQSAAHDKCHAAPDAHAGEGKITILAPYVHAIPSNPELDQSGVSDELRVNSYPWVNLTLALNLRTPQRGNGSQNQLSEIHSVDSTVL